jgi:hypothetical protein
MATAKLAGVRFDDAYPAAVEDATSRVVGTIERQQWQLAFGGKLREQWRAACTNTGERCRLNPELLPD